MKYFQYWLDSTCHKHRWDSMHKQNKHPTARNCCNSMGKHLRNVVPPSAVVKNLSPIIPVQLSLHEQLPRQLTGVPHSLFKPIGKGSLEEMSAGRSLRKRAVHTARGGKDYCQFSGHNQWEVAKPWFTFVCLLLFSSAEQLLAKPSTTH